jgi:hypothetical protein
MSSRLAFPAPFYCQDRAQIVAAVPYTIPPLTPSPALSFGRQKEDMGS